MGGGSIRRGTSMTDATKAASERTLLDRYFRSDESGTNVRTELVAGLTTFLTMVYIVFVNPQILGNAGTRARSSSRPASRRRSRLW